tara:strand:- start:13012 stop:13509 length:498 start_codon:yes stop_codon:yes gene_type:complete
MSICPISNEYRFTFTGVRADDGGQPEELIATVITYGAEGTYGVEPYDTRVDNNFTFIGFNDGVYNLKLTGGVSGVVMSQDFLVDHNAKTSVSQLVRDEVDSMMCGECIDDEAYVLSKALLSSSVALIECGITGGSGENITATDALNKIDLVLKGGCGTKLCASGC